MDGVSAAASVAGVATIAAQLSKSLYEICQDIKEAEKDIRKVADDVELISTVLRDLEVHFQQNKVTGAPIYRRNHVLRVKEICDRCELIFEDINNVTGIKERTAPKVTLLTRLQWCFRKGRVKLLQANLESLKSTLQVLLQVMILAKSSAQEDRLRP